MLRVDGIKLDVSGIKGSRSTQLWADSKANEHGIGLAVDASYLESKTKSARAFSPEIDVWNCVMDVVKPLAVHAGTVLLTCAESSITSLAARIRRHTDKQTK